MSVRQRPVHKAQPIDVGIGVQVEGRFQWRSYSISSEPKRKGRTISITVRAMPEGLLSSHLVKGLEPGTIVRLNTGEVGSVVAVNRNHPLRPRVEIVDGKTGPLAAPKIVDLSEAPFLYITGPVTEPAR